MNYISAKDWTEKYANDANYHLIDIREPYETADSKLTCEYIPMDQLIASPEKLANNIQHVIMCNSGKRAEAVVNLLETEHQINNLIILEGGYAAIAEIL